MEQEKTYAIGFSAGYKLAKYSPDLVELLTPSLSENVPYEKGLLAGIEEAEQERRKLREEELNALREEGQGEEQDLSI